MLSANSTAHFGSEEASADWPVFVRIPLDPDSLYKIWSPWAASGSCLPTLSSCCVSSDLELKVERRSEPNLLQPWPLPIIWRKRRTSRTRNLGSSICITIIFSVSALFPWEFLLLKLRDFHKFLENVVNEFLMAVREMILNDGESPSNRAGGPSFGHQRLQEISKIIFVFTQNDVTVLMPSFDRIWHFWPVTLIKSLIRHLRPNRNHEYQISLSK